MLFLSIIILIICKALINDKLPNGFYHRISAIILLFSGLLDYIVYNLDSISGIGIYSGLFNISPATQPLDYQILVNQSYNSLTYDYLILEKLFLIICSFFTKLFFLFKNTLIGYYSLLDSFHPYITCSELFSNVLGIIKFKFSLFGLSFSILTFFKLVLYFLIFLLVIYILFLEKYIGKEVRSELSEESPMLQSGFFSRSTYTTLSNISKIVVGTAGAMVTLNQFHKEFIKGPSIETAEEYKVKLYDLETENKNCRRENENLSINLMNEKVKNTSFISSVELHNSNIEKSQQKIEILQEKQENILFKIMKSNNPSEKSSLIRELESNKILLEAIILERNNHLELRSKLIKEYGENLNNESNSDKTTDSSKESNSDKTTDSSKDNSNSGSSNPPILSTLESEVSIKLSRLKELSISFLILNSAILSCAVNIIFTLFGEYLINRFSLESRFPKLAKYIALRRKFQSYYLKINIALIIIDVLIQISLFLFIMTL